MAGLTAGLGDSVRRLAGTVVGIAHTRLALLATELEEEKHRLLSVMAWGAFGVLMASMGLVFLAAWVTVLLWESHRLWALGGVTAAFFGACAVAWWQVHRHMARAQGLLQATLAELETDRQALHLEGP
jgi:uncharacterized membrane protein YqjE